MTLAWLVGKKIWRIDVCKCCCDRYGSLLGLAVRQFLHIGHGCGRVSSDVWRTARRRLRAQRCYAFTMNAWREGVRIVRHGRFS